MSMRPDSKWSRVLPLVFALSVGWSSGGAATAAYAGSRVDDPDYGSTYGRVRYLEGSLSLQRTGDGEIADATLNDPVAPGDRLTTGDGRSEIALSDGSTLWLDRGTRLDVRNLADIDNRYETTNLLALEVGAIRIDAPDQESGNRTYRVDTESGSIYLLSGGSFRIEMDQGVTTVYSFRGVAELSGDDGSVLVRSGERGSVQGGRAPSEPRRFNTARLDDFDRFCEIRQDAYVRRGGEDTGRIVEDVPYEVHPYVNELSYYGSWHNVPDYGRVWRPAYSGSWGPYVNGYWSWCPTGWVWVSSDPWGWAPYHYGRWDYLDIGWVWIPGRIWSGAWVSFAVGTSHIGWCPLNYWNRPVFQDVTIVNVINVNPARLQPRGWRYVSVDQFTNPRAPRGVVRVDRVPRGADVVLTSRLPRFNPRDVAGAPERGARFVETVRQTRSPLPITVDRDNKPVSFRSGERSVQQPAGRRPGPAQVQPDRARGAQRGGVRPDVRSGAPAPGPRQPESVVRPGGRANAVPGQGTRQPAAPRDNARDNSGDAVRQRGRESAPPPRQRVAPPAGGSFSTPGRPPDPSSRGDRSPFPPANPRRAPEAPRRDVSREPARRPSAYSDQAIERLFDGVRGRPRVEAPRVPPPQAARPETRPPRAEQRPPQERPAPRPQPKPKEGNDKSRGH